MVSVKKKINEKHSRCGELVSVIRRRSKRGQAGELGDRKQPFGRRSAGGGVGRVGGGEMECDANVRTDPRVDPRRRNGLSTLRSRAVESQKQEAVNV